MTSGYRMAQFEFRRSIEAKFPAAQRSHTDWRFLEVESLLAQGPRFETVKKHLAIAASGAFKVWKLSKPLTVLGTVFVAAIAGGLLYAWRRWSEMPVVTVGGVGWSVIGALAAMIGGSILVRLVRFRETLGQVGLITAVTVIASIGFKIHLLMFDPLFLKLGRLARFTGGTSRTKGPPQPAAPVPGGAAQ
jgi:hypothetical protein